MILFDRPLTTESGVESWEGVANTFQGQRLRDQDWVRLRQPFLDSRGRACVSRTDINYGRSRSRGYTKNDSRGGERKPLVRNYLINDLRNMGYQLPMACNAALLTKQQWIHLDQRTVPAFRQELRLWQDLESAAPLGGFDAYAKRTYEYIAVSDPGYAYVDMDAETDGTNDSALNVIRSVPLPITHCDFGFTDRELEVSKQGPVPLPLDTNNSEWAARRVGEVIEDTSIGNVTGVTYGSRSGDATVAHDGTSTVYGVTNYPQRLLKANFTAPTSGSPETTYNEVLAAIQQLLNQYHRGPFVLYHSLDWNQYMQRQFSVSGGNNAGETLRTMLLKIPQISDVRLLERLTSTFTFLFVDMSGKSVQAINGRDIYTVQWMEKGGLQLRFKVLCIKVTVFKHDYNDRTGILHGTTS